MNSSLPDIEQDDIYDISVIGAGMSGLMLIRALLENPGMAGKRILLLERSLANYAPRTWCYWEKMDANAKPEPGTQKTWNTVECLLDDERLTLDLQPFRYHMIDAGIWRQTLLTDFSSRPNIKIVQADILQLEQVDSHVLIHTGNKKILAKWSFDSRWDTSVLQSYNGRVMYQQFLGWNIMCSDGLFDEHRARLMDFRVSQPGAVAFCYVLPRDQRQALVEYTLFTPAILPWEHLTHSLQVYMDQHYPAKTFQVDRRENGIIPMTDFPFAGNSQRVINIGTAGGCTKPTTGYTFLFAREHASAIVAALAAERQPPNAASLYSRRFSWYDRVMLRVIQQAPEKGAAILYRMFKRNDPGAVLRFLNNKSSLWEEIELFMSLPIYMFLRSACRTGFP